MQLLRPVCDAAGAPAGWQLQPVVLPSWAASQHTAAAPAEVAEAAVADAVVSDDESAEANAGVHAFVRRALAMPVHGCACGVDGARMTQTPRQLLFKPISS